MYESFLYGNKTEENLIIQLVDERELELIPKEMEEIQKLTGKEDFAFLAVKVDNWNIDLSPWNAPAVFGNEDFGDGATETLQYLNDLAEGEYKGKRIILGGYSLAGLFALWAATKSSYFGRIAAVSPSVWFPGFTEYLAEHKTIADIVYLSLGDKESKTRNATLATTDECIKKTHNILLEQGVKCILEWNEGNHFSNPEIRMAKGLSWILNMRDDEKQKYNSIQFELFLWNRVHLAKLTDGTSMFTRARYIEDTLFPELIVRGYNEANDCEEEFSLKCWSKADELSKEEWMEIYNTTGENPAFSFSEIEQRIRGHRMELKILLEKYKK